MKRLVLPVLLLPFLFYSCKKDNTQVTPVNTSKKYQVQFGVSGFQQIILSTAKGSGNENSKIFAASPGNAMTLDYLVYDSNGNLVHSTTQLADTTRTMVKDSLPAGTYTFCFVVGGPSRQISPSFKELTYPGAVWEDTFVKQVIFTVGPGNVTQNVTLDRLVAQLETDITGAIPPNAAKITINVDKEYMWGKFSGQPDTTLKANTPTSFTFPLSQSGTKFCFVLLNTVSPFNVELTAYDASGSVLAKATVNNVKCAVNTRTVLSGSLFGNQSSTFTVSLNNQWVTDPFKTINF